MTSKQINDVKNAALLSLGFTDELQYWQSLGATKNQLNDAINEVIEPLNLFDYMLANGATGNDINAVQFSYWQSIL